MSNPSSASIAIKRRARELGFDLVGITTGAAPDHAGQFQQWLADGFHGEMGYMQRRAGERVAPKVKTIIVVGMNYYTGDHRQPPHLDPLPASGERRLPSPLSCKGEGQGEGYPARLARYAWGARDYHDVLGDKLRQLAEFVGDSAKWHVDTGPILERDLAQRAGIGFIGKHTNLINRGLGNWLFLGVVLTDLELTPDQPGKEYCGTCRRCLDACPTRAIVAPYRLDARLCISYLTIELKGAIPVELRPLIGDRVFGCDDCLEVCPWNRFARQSPVKEFQRRELPALAEFLSWDETKFRDYFRSTPIYRIKRRGFLRNVCVALGNIGDKSSLPALERACRDVEPLVREHAAWAVQQILSQ